jgi:hypothetical protein
MCGLSFLKNTPYMQEIILKLYSPVRADYSKYLLIDLKVMKQKKYLAKRISGWAKKIIRLCWQRTKSNWASSTSNTLTLSYALLDAVI